MPRINYVEPAVMLATILQWLFLATVAGAFVGSGTSLFLHGLFFLTERTASVPLWVQMLLLPLGGILNGLLLYYGYRWNTAGLTDSVITSVHKQSGRMPFKTVAIKPLAALITLASGGSAGKEGPCSHIGGSLASAIGRMLRLNVELQKRIVACGVSAGFASVFGTPIAGAIYGVEVLAIGRIRHDFLFPAIIAGVTSFEVSKMWGVPYTYYLIPVLPEFSEILFIKTIVIGIVCGLVAWFFVDMLTLSRKMFERLRTRFAIWPPLMPFLGGVLLSALIIVIPTDYLGLSLPLVSRALDGEAMPFLGVVWKTLLVAITLGSGFYGGIATPQFVIGAIAGSAVADLLDVDPALGAAVGLVSVIAAASNTPIAAILMGIELFGGMAGTIYGAGAAIAAYLIIGHRSVYPDQPVAYPKSSWMLGRPDLTLGEEKFRLSYGLLKWLSRHQPGPGRPGRPPRRNRPDDRA
ncbi:chloride channel protein [Oceanibacterium hippocampi]|uniref:H(+)/Cl(-) exchange transporter ClcA n=1 Tax=Oceanibacterium hippocampi TaxID=745714 RepID=A0A1Y5S1C9_9PROT|nr:chloride channel protein [Oceanibacterium hippocampi]SLN29411.1 H(+)/Cl(-) exchange transporter ClcA [Oceanibacterium hippocampi]